MRTRNLTVIALILVLLLPRGFTCSCSNQMPIQKSSLRYTSPDHAVFTARIVALIGTIFDWDGKRASSLALAIVHERYWGLPWYWPKVVLLDGSYPCDTVLRVGDDYLVAGRKGFYGVVAVNLCSRTQPLATAQIDLRTLDGSHCAGPGGTLIGNVYGWQPIKRIVHDEGPIKYERVPAHVDTVTFSGYGVLGGGTYASKVDENGTYEIQHLPRGMYVPNSRLDNHRYLSVRGRYTAYDGVCQEAGIRVSDYQITGSLLPGIGGSVKVELADLETGARPISANDIEPDGRYYFRDVPAGTYILSVSPLFDDTNRVYYPGVADIKKAEKVVISGGTLARSYDFAPHSLPLVPVTAVFDSVAGSERFWWRFSLLRNGLIVNELQEYGTNGGLAYLKRGEQYQIALYGHALNPEKDSGCRSADVSLTATDGMAPIHMARCDP